MANEIKGEFALTAGDETYTLVLGVNQLCIAEGALGVKSNEIMRSLVAGGDMRTLRTLLWCALQTHHSDLSIDDAGEIATEVGPIVATATMIRGLTLTFPPPKDAGGDGAARPTPRRAKATPTA